jgi:two-component system response regulator
MSASILLVEDTASDEELTLLALKKSSVACEVAVARDGAAALDYLFSAGLYADRDASAFPSLVLLDLNLPRFGGLEVLRRIRSDDRTKTLPVVILTSSSEDDDVLQARALGSNAYMRKLMGFSAYSAAIHTLIVFWLTLNQRVPVRRTATVPPR